jgi:hypothetical protein
VVLLALLAAREAAAKSFYLPAADVHVTVEPDGTLAIEERITFFFDGSFTGAYRDIQLRDGERISEVSVAEGGVRYSPGASAELGSSGAPNTYGERRRSTAATGSSGISRPPRSRAPSRSATG